MFDHLPPPAPIVVIDGNFGGVVDDFVRDVETYRRRGVAVHVKGACMSSCTMVLALKRTCVEPGGSFHFHQAFPVYPGRPPDVTDRDETATGIVWDHYPRAVRAWINRHGGLTGTLITLQGAELRGVVPACHGPSHVEGNASTINAIPAHRNAFLRASANVSIMLTNQHGGSHVGQDRKDRIVGASHKPSGERSSSQSGYR